MSKLVVAIDARLVAGSSTGDSSYWTGLVEGLSRVPSDVRFLLFSNAPRPATIPEDGRFSWIALPSRLSRWWSLARFPLAARRLGADVVHTQYSLSPLVRRGGVTTIHDVSYFIGPEWYRPRDRAILQYTVPASCRRAARVIAVSETDRGEIERYVPVAKGKIAVTYNACPSWIIPTERSAAKELVKNQTGIDEPYILTIGTRWPRKNLALALDAADLLPKFVPHRLVVTGKPSSGLDSLGARGVAVGYVERNLLSALYCAADLYVAPSRHEGFGIPLLEAFRCGCPVMCSTGGALPEVAGDAAVVEASWAPAEWARTITNLVGDASKLGDLRRRGLEREKFFTWEDTARRTLDVYREAAR